MWRRLLVKSKMFPSILSNAIPFSQLLILFAGRLVVFPPVFPARIGRYSDAVITHRCSIPNALGIHFLVTIAFAAVVQTNQVCSWFLAFTQPCQWSLDCREKPKRFLLDWLWLFAVSTLGQATNIMQFDASRKWQFFSFRCLQQQCITYFDTHVFFDDEVKDCPGSACGQVIVQVIADYTKHILQ